MEFEERRMAAGRRLEADVRDPVDRRPVAPELDDPIVLRPGDEHRAAERRRELPGVGAGAPEAGPRLREERAISTADDTMRSCSARAAGSGSTRTRRGAAAPPDGVAEDDDLGDAEARYGRLAGW